MFGRSIQLQNIGRLKRGWGKWYGQLAVAELKKPLDLRIQIAAKEPVEPFAEQARLFAATYAQLQEHFRDELFENNQFYKKLDMEDGGLTKADFAKHPPVESAADVWNVLRPFRLCLGLPMHRYLGNAYLLMDVDWPNPHYFQMYMAASPTGFEYKHTDFVG